MATAKAESRMERIVTRVDLSMTADEAQFLADVMARIGGSPSNTRRRFAESITKALHGAGIDWADSSFVEDYQITDMEGRIRMQPVD